MYVLYFTQIYKNKKIKNLKHKSLALLYQIYPKCMYIENTFFIFLLFLLFLFISFPFHLENFRQQQQHITYIPLQSMNLHELVINLFMEYFDVIYIIYC